MNKLFWARAVKWTGIALFWTVVIFGIVVPFWVAVWRLMFVVILSAVLVVVMSGFLWCVNYVDKQKGKQ